MVCLSDNFHLYKTSAPSMFLSFHKEYNCCCSELKHIPFTIDSYYWYLLARTVTIPFKYVLVLYLQNVLFKPYIHSHETRSQGKIHQWRTMHEYARKCIGYNIPNTVNSTPTRI